MTFDSKKSHNFNKKEFKNIKNVLVVSCSDNKTLKKILSINNIESVSLENGIDAIDILKSKLFFDFAIIDYDIPYLNGIELIKHIRKNLKLNNNNLPIIALSDSIKNDFIKQVANELDIKYTLTKPVKVDKLYDAISKIQSSKNKEQEKLEKDKKRDLSELIFKIIIAEDDPVIKFISKTTLEKILPKAVIIEVNNGQEAIDVFEKEKIDLILMDIQMPIINGIEATEIIRRKEEHQNKIPIIALSGKSLKGDKEFCIKHGMNDYFAKPLKLDTMEKIIIDYLVKPLEDIK